MRITRWIVIAAAALAATGALAEDKVSLRLNWYLGGLHVPFYYGKERGFFAAEGLDLTINEGRGSANTVQVVAAGSDTFGMADSSSVITTAAKGAEIQSVMSLLNSTGFSVVSLVEANLKTPKDLEGKRVAVSPGDPLGALLQAVCKANNVDCAKISMVQVDPPAKVVTVLEKRADALLGGADDQFFLIKQRGFTPAAMRYADFGANIVGMTIVAKNDLIKSKPDLVRRFVRASVKSWEEAKKNPALELHVWPGILLSIALWLALASLWSKYLAITNYSFFYAGMSQLMIAMIFFQFTAIAILLGAELNRGIMEYKRMTRSGNPITGDKA